MRRGARRTARAPDQWSMVVAMMIMVMVVMTLTTMMVVMRIRAK